MDDNDELLDEQLDEQLDESSAPSSVDFGPLAAAGVTAEELAGCISVLSRLQEAEETGTLDRNAACLRPLRKALSLHLRHSLSHLPQKDVIDDKERKRLEKERKRERRQRQLEADKRWKENAQLRASRLAKLEALEGSAGDSMLMLADGAEVSQALQGSQRIPDGPADAEHPTVPEMKEAEESAEYQRQQACYICKVRFSERHHFYSHLCPACAALNFEKRNQTRDMTGRVCLVTGARVKIGFQVALKFLRMGARVLVTSRFPRDALSRYATETDAAEWMDRLRVIGADFRFLGGVEAMCQELCQKEPYLDVVVNNACQTIRRPAAYYAHLLEGEAGAATRAVTDSTAQAAQALDFEHSGYAVDQGSAALSQLTVLSEDRMRAEEVAMALPSGQRDVHGQQLDLRSSNSWLLKLGEIQTPEAAEVFCINTLAPFIINSTLRPLLERSPKPDRYIVNVSAMEGKFYRYKQPTHPHTNMAKAALNMMTRTCAEDLAMNSGVYMNSVDTGWINDENPLPTAQRIAESHNFQTPIDEIDAAARIVDPVLLGMASMASTVGRPKKRGAMAGGLDGEGPPWGWFLKDYMQSEPWWKARRLVESLNPSGGGKGMGNGNAAVQAMQMAEQDQGFPVDPDAAQFLIGTIKISQFDPSSSPVKDFSLIECPDTGLPQDVYVRGAVATSQAFTVGDLVAFSFHMTAKGPQATAVFKLVGFVQQGREVHFPPYQGLIHRVLPNGNGFIKCDAITAEYGKDAFIHASVVQQCGLNEQDIIAFDVHISKEGNPQASAPCWQQIAPTSNFQAVMQAPQVQARMPGAFQSPMAGKGGGKAPLGKGGKAPMRPATLTLSKGGTVRVQGPTTQAPKGGAWMGTKGQALPPGPLKGGMPTPKPKPLLSKGWPSWPNPKGNLKGTGGGQGPARDSWGAEAAANKVDELEIDWMPDEFHAGRVCLVDVTKNVSMVRCPGSNLTRDVYVHQSVAEPSALAVNDVVCFKIHTNKHGLPQASAPLWKRIGTDATDSVVRFGEFQGLVVRSDDGSTSIDCAEVIQLHGKDASMSEDSMNACGLVEGNFISFEVSLDDNGDPQALPPCWICCSSERWVKDLVGAKEEALANSAQTPVADTQTMNIHEWYFRLF
eukprot:s1882_g6.t1